MLLAAWLDVNTVMNRPEEMIFRSDRNASPTPETWLTDGVCLLHTLICFFPAESPVILVYIQYGVVKKEIITTVHSLAISQSSLFELLLHYIRCIHFLFVFS